LSRSLFEVIKTDGTGINQQSVANVDKKESLIRLPDFKRSVVVKIEKA